MTMIADNLQRVRGRIEAACLEAGRHPSAVRSLAVSKTFDAAAVRTAFEAGQRAFGENYIQEGVDKIARLRHSDGALFQPDFFGFVVGHLNSP